MLRTIGHGVDGRKFLILFSGLGDFSRSIRGSISTALRPGVAYSHLRPIAPQPHCGNPSAFEREETAGKAICTKELGRLRALTKCRKTSRGRDRKSGSHRTRACSRFEGRRAGNPRHLHDARSRRNPLCFRLDVRRLRPTDAVAFRPRVSQTDSVSEIGSQQTRGCFEI